MKRPEMVALFGPVASGRVELAQRWLTFLIDKEGCTLNSYFARLEFDPEASQYDFVDETLNLPDRKVLVERIAAHDSGFWSCRVPMGFANADVYSAVFGDPRHSSQTTLQLQIEPSITRFVEEQPVTHTPFVAFLVRVAHWIGAPWFIAGLHLPMSPLNREAFLQGGGPGTHSYVAGWQPQALDAHVLLEQWQVSPQQIQQSVLGYSVVTRFPPR